jgi:hypothetical protein
MGSAALRLLLSTPVTTPKGRLSACIMAREQDLPVLEAETILQEMRDVLLNVAPDPEQSPDVDELDAAVDDRSGE